MKKRMIIKRAKVRKVALELEKLGFNKETIRETIDKFYIVKG